MWSSRAKDFNIEFMKLSMVFIEKSLKLSRILSTINPDSLEPFSASPFRSDSILSFISFAALFVNVIPSICGRRSGLDFNRDIYLWDRA